MTESPIEAIQDAQGTDSVVTEDAIAYLAHYGYIASGIASAAISPVLAVFNFAAAVMEMQAVAGLPQTGQLDDATRAKMAEPRCGVLDVMRMVEFARWRKNNLTYRIEKYVPGMSTSDQDDLQEEGWKKWMDIADVKVTRVTGTKADITVTALEGRQNGMDGPGGTLAWCYLPTGSDSPLTLAFDLSEAYVRSLTQGQRGILYGNVDTHEKGHGLGLDHSRVSSALMAPYYSPGTSKPQANDDIPRIVALYGAATGTPPTTPTPTDDQIEVAGRYRGQLFRGKLTPSAT